MNNELILTEDGSHTLFVTAIDESYHSTHGAIQESRHIFIEAGLNQCAKSEINVLEIGFGTGLNAFMTLLEAEKRNLKIHYTSLELYPVELGQALQLNYPKELSLKNNYEFEKMHTSAWDDEIHITPFFTLKKTKTDFTTCSFETYYDVVFFDAFSPEKQPEMWTQQQFSKIYAHCNPGAILATYCAKGIVRRALQAAGFAVERLPGPKGKREILRGSILKFPDGI
jgi:tRNA U34 5-methylaminomethyl-2-thiouridine-forming methyltransferase MnmC